MSMNRSLPGLPAGYAIWEDTPPEQVRDGIIYVSRSLAELRGWVPAPLNDDEWDGS